jgi:predicted rRNA methylase YqxC with S4 and FtsJ domains
MRVTEKLCNINSQPFFKIEAFQGIVGNFKQSFSWPGHKVNNGGVIDKTRVHTPIISEIITSFAHQEDYMEVILDSSIKLCEQNLIFYLFILSLFT